MVATYAILGRQVGSHYVQWSPINHPRSTSANQSSQLALATLGVTFGGTWLAMRGDGSEKAKAPPTNASSKDEETFIQYGSPLVRYP